MKRSKLNYEEWKCILSKDLECKNVENDLLNGYISLLHIHEVSEPQVWRFNGEDLVVYPDGKVLEDDMDELEDALRSGDISKELFDLAIETCGRLRNGLLSDIGEFKEFTRKCYESQRL